MLSVRTINKKWIRHSLAQPHKESMHIWKQRYVTWLSSLSCDGVMSCDMVSPGSSPALPCWLPAVSPDAHWAGSRSKGVNIEVKGQEVRTQGESQTPFHESSLIWMWVSSRAGRGLYPLTVKCINSTTQLLSLEDYLTIQPALLCTGGVFVRHHTEDNWLKQGGTAWTCRIRNTLCPLENVWLRCALMNTTHPMRPPYRREVDTGRSMGN